MNNIVEIYCAVDDFMKTFLPAWEKQLIAEGKKKRLRRSRLSPSEVATILILFHPSDYRTLKHFYLTCVCQHWQDYFPDLVSYSQFVRLQQSMLVPLSHYLLSRRGKVTGISYVDSTPIAVCHNKRITRNKVFQGIAQRGKTSMGWFFGFKLHLVVNHQGELLSFYITPGNRDDRQPLDTLTKGITGKLLGDKGYISKEKTACLLKRGWRLITTIRRTMKHRLLEPFDTALLKKRFIIETINDQLKNKAQIEHSRHRCLFNFMVNLMAGLVAYTHQKNKPSIQLTEIQALTYN